MATNLQAQNVPAEILRVVTTLTERGFRAVLVGGCVRDMRMGRVPKDFDVATSATPQEVQASFPRTVPTGIEHGTVTVLVGKTGVEVTTFRSEGAYVDGRRPQSVEFHTDVEADLARRDFTINAMALDVATGELVDPYGGQADLAARVIRAVGNPLDRFGEDGLRAMRAVRFATVLEFEIEPSTQAAIAATLATFNKIAIERVREEFTKIVEARRPARGLELLKRSGLLQAFAPEALAADFSQVERAPADLDTRLCLLFSSAPNVRNTLGRLKYPTRTCDRVAHWSAHLEVPPPDSPDEAVRRWAARVGRPEAEGAARAAAAHERIPASVVERVRAVLSSGVPLSADELALDGQAVMSRLGVPPGRVVGEAIRFLLDLVLGDPAQNTPEKLGAALSTWHARTPR